MQPLFSRVRGGGVDFIKIRSCQSSTLRMNISIGCELGVP